MIGDCLVPTHPCGEPERRRQVNALLPFLGAMFRLCFQGRDLAHGKSPLRALGRDTGYLAIELMAGATAGKGANRR